MSLLIDSAVQQHCSVAQLSLGWSDNAAIREE